MRNISFILHIRDYTYIYANIHTLCIARFSEGPVLSAPILKEGMYWVYRDSSLAVHIKDPRYGP